MSNPGSLTPTPLVTARLGRVAMRYAKLPGKVQFDRGFERYVFIYIDLDVNLALLSATANQQQIFSEKLHVISCCRM